MIQRLLAISEYLGRFPSIGYIFLYLLSIPGFAAVYAFYIPSHFYHSTVQYEAILHEDANALLSKIQSAIKNEFEAAHGGITKSDGNWIIDISQIDIHSLRPEGNRTAFEIFFQLKGVNDYEGVESGQTLKCSIENQVGYATASSPNYEMVIFKQPECQNKERALIDLKILFPAGTENLNPLILWLPINQDTQDSINAFNKASKGFPANVSGVYSRMFYFSAVTITTLGYGDIVPITNTARSFVSIESILGIVLIGMFLNSLSREGKNA